jgi:hypothetical protein
MLTKCFRSKERVLQARARLVWGREMLWWEMTRMMMMMIWRRFHEPLRCCLARKYNTSKPSHFVVGSRIWRQWYCIVCMIAPPNICFNILFNWNVLHTDHWFILDLSNVDLPPHTPSNLAFSGLNSNTSQNSLESKARPRASKLRGKARTLVSDINSRIHRGWGPWGSPLSCPTCEGGWPQADARSHQSYMRPSVRSQRWPEALEGLACTARMARETSCPWIICILPYNTGWNKTARQIMFWYASHGTNLSLERFLGRGDPSHPVSHRSGAAP